MTGKFDSDFIENLVGFDFETLENHPDSVYGLSKDLTLSYFNPAWFKFSMKIMVNPRLQRIFL